MADHDKIFNWLKISMRSVGRNISFPKAKDRTKTYLWRQLDAFSRKIKELEIDDDLAGRMVDIIVQHAKDNGLLNRGASLLAKMDLIEICHDKLREEVRAESKLVDDVKRSALFLEKQQDGCDRIGALLGKRRMGAYANITCWMQEGKISKSFIALSKSCYKALGRLDEDERKDFPDDSDIIKIRYKILTNKQLGGEIGNIMGTDMSSGGIR